MRKLKVISSNLKSKLLKNNSKVSRHKTDYKNNRW